MAPTTTPMVKPTAAPPSTPRMHTPPMIMTTEARSSSALNGAEEEAAEATETTPLNVNERETHFGGSSVGVVVVAGQVSESGNGHHQTTSGGSGGQLGLLNPSSANCLAPAAAAAAAAGGSGGSPGVGGSGLSVSQRVRRVSMAMSIASEGKKVAPEISLSPKTFQGAGQSWRRSFFILDNNKNMPVRYNDHQPRDEATTCVALCHVCVRCSTAPHDMLVPRERNIEARSARETA